MYIVDGCYVGVFGRVLRMFDGKVSVEFINSGKVVIVRFSEFVEMYES